MKEKKEISNGAKNQKGLSLYISIIIMSILLAIVLGISTILVSQLKIIKGIEHSVIAFYAAETGIEQVLVARVNPISFNGYSGVLANGASYEIIVFASGSDCPAPNFCINSIGDFRGAKRTIQVSY